MLHALFQIAHYLLTILFWIILIQVILSWLFAFNVLNTSSPGQNRTPRAFTLSIMFVPPGQGNASHRHEVEEVFLHCARSFRRGRLWDQASWPGPDAVASMPCMLYDQTKGAMSLEALEARNAQSLVTLY